MDTLQDENRIRILLVEDDEDDYVLTTALFSDMEAGKYEFDWVKTFDEAVERTGSDGYDVCLLDYRLGERDGLELMRELRERGFSSPMILLTGQGDDEIDLKAMKAGAADYLDKEHISANILARSIRYAIQQKRFAEERINRIREHEARMQAEAANRAKDEFLAVLSHELRTPLNAMLGWARLLRTNRDNHDIFDRAVDAIERSAILQTKFVDDLLDVTRIVNGTLSLTKVAVAPADFIEPAVDGMRPVAAAKSVELVSKVDESTRQVLGDPARLQQVVNNLLSNAIKFTPEGGKVTLDLDREDDFARFRIADTGEGIDPEFLPKVFDRYRQAHNSTTNRKGGLGLGLAIVRSLVEMHEGTVSVESPGIGHGATFTVRIPLMNEHYEQAA
jgi:signal transduction histidine kinase